MSKDVLLVLHGNQQTGELLLGRIERLTKKLKKEFGFETIAPDAPFFAPSNHHHRQESSSSLLRTWWNRSDDGNNANINSYVGLEESLAIVQSLLEEETKRNNIVGLLGFSQGARFAHLLAMLHHKHPNTWFPNLKFVVLVAGYEKPIPPEIIPYLRNRNCDDENEESTDEPLGVPSLHIWGSNDSLIHKDEFEGLVANYTNPQVYIHPGKHHVPTKGSEIPTYLDFIRKALSSFSTAAAVPEAAAETTPIAKTTKTKNTIPDEETMALQQEEVQALEAIFPGAIDLRSERTCNDDGEEIFGFPIVYRISLNDMEMDADVDDANDETDSKNWPKHPLTIEIQYPLHYPSDDQNEEEQKEMDTTVPHFRLLHQNTVMEFPTAVSGKLVSILEETARNERGMPCVLSCLYASRDFLDQDRNWKESSSLLQATTTETARNDDADKGNEKDTQSEYEAGKEHHPLIRASTPSEIRTGTLEGLEIAQTLLQANNSEVLPKQQSSSSSSESSSSIGNSDALYCGSGSFGTYTIGLVGKPSAGKSTFFNAATAFSRQRGQNQEAASGQSSVSAGTPASVNSTDISSGENISTNRNNTNDGLGGASMAAHPFTTIDPNIGYCLIPAPPGSCPEDDHCEDSRDGFFGSTHGRDASGRRFLPVLLKDVAGLVPGAYQGKGRGNQFLNDLTDAAILIHVVDASGSTDASGNKIVVEHHQRDDGDDASQEQLTNPLDDLAWIRSELMEWVYSNLVAKWEVISRRGRTKLAGMFSGYGQKIDITDTMFPALERFLEDRYQRERALDKIYEWNEADIQRLVSLFLGVRFPMALCLNKSDLPSSKGFVENVTESLPVHGAHVGTPLSARNEMAFVREHMKSVEASTTHGKTFSPPLGVWRCLQSAIALRKPVLVFPVSDLVTLAPMAGLNKAAVGDPSLPSGGMVRCIEASSGSPPSLWNSEECNYSLPTATRDNNIARLRDVILMKPGSTVEDVFYALKRLGALGGEFVRAEASSGALNARPKPVPKQEVMSKKNRVIKIMTNKRTQWQNTVPDKKERNRYQSRR